MTALSDVLDPLTITHWWRQPVSGVLTSTGDTGGISLGSPSGAIQGQSHPVTGEYSEFFDGSDDNHKSAITTTTVNLATGTVAALFKTDASISYSVQKTIVNFITNSGGAIGMTLFFEQTSGDFIFRLQSTYPTNYYELQIAAASHSLDDAGWHFVAVVQNGTAPAIYVDGTDVTSDFTESSAGTFDATDWLDTLITAGANRMGIGAFGGSPTNTHNFHGYVGDVIVTSAQLSASEISDIAVVMGVQTPSARQVARGIVAADGLTRELTRLI